MEQLKITTFGEFCLQAGANRISDGDNRSRKVWMLLGYLLCRKNRFVPTDELIEQVWGEDFRRDNRENSLKVSMHRARTLLDKLWSGAGHDLILNGSGGYRWNPDIAMELDAEVFEKLCQQEDLESRLQALTLYKGDFLEKLSSGAWVIPIATHYHDLFVRTLLSVLPELMDGKQYQQAVLFCRKAVRLEPYNEELYRYLMQALLAVEDVKGAVAVYDNLRSLLLHDFGITPAKETMALYRSIVHTPSDNSMPVETVLAHLLESDPEAGALKCDFECFKVLCHAEARAMLRSGNATHVALLSVTGTFDKVLSRRSLDCAMENLGEQIRTNLRRGDAFTQCSPSQYVILLPQANYENSCMVCRRVTGAFYRRYPHSPTQIHFIVQPLSVEEQ